MSTFYLLKRILFILPPWNGKGYCGNLCMTRKEKSAFGKLIYLEILEMGNYKTHNS